MHLKDETKTRKAVLLTAVAIFPTGLCVLLEVIKGQIERLVRGLESDEDEQGVGALSQQFGGVPMAMDFRTAAGEGGFRAWRTCER